MTATRRVLCTALGALTLLFVAWFWREPATLLVFAFPSAALFMAAFHGTPRAGFWAGVVALAWFSHGIMVAWTRAPERAFALVEVALAVAIVFAASTAGLRIRFGKKRG